mgnify:CR=1 FL=1
MAKAKKAKKEWYTIIAPSYLKNVEIGKTLANDPNLLIGRKLTVSAIDVTNDMNKYYLKLTFRITEVNGNIAKSEFEGSECLRDYIARMVLRRVKRIDVVQDLVTKDGKKIRVKSLVVLPRRPTSSVRKAVRKRVSELVEKIVTNSKLADVVNDILNEKIKRKIYREIKKIYPVRNFEIRKTEIIHK